MIGSIVACDPNGLIGVDGKMCWSYPEDFKRFKIVTQGSTLIMGATTWESIPGTLPGRNVIVISSRPQSEVIGNRKNIESLLPRFEMATSIDMAFEKAAERNTPIWVAGGTQIYKQTMDKVDFIDFTLVPEVVLEQGVAKYFPMEDLNNKFTLESEMVNSEDSRLTHRIYRKLNG